MNVIIDGDFDGRTVKDWLYRHHISRKMITHLKKLPRGITVNGEHVTVRYVLHTGDLLVLECDDRAEDENENLIPKEMPLDILYEDDNLIAVNKPPNMATHPSIGHFCDTLANGLAYYFAKRGIPFVFRAVNRLDRDTSGVVLIAKNRPVASELADLMQAGRIRKTYIAVLNGKLSPPSGEINACIRRKREGIILRETCDENLPDAKSARTVYETVASCADASIVRAEPITGRTHQLRVHFAHKGCPIVGDGLYGTAETAPSVYDRAMTRHALHAAALTVERDSGILTFKAPLPPDMQMLCDKICRTETECN